METEKRIPELVIIPSQIGSERKLTCSDDFVSCYDCNSHLFYIVMEWGVVAENKGYEVVGDRSERSYQLREVGFVLYCAKCGCFKENYGKYFYPEDTLIMPDLFDLGIDEDERAEIDNCLHQFNQKGSFESRYKAPVFDELKGKLEEYERKHPIEPEQK